jgi:NTP pyrophosphatase (non-canonical NTP hydrolase)
LLSFTVFSARATQQVFGNADHSGADRTSDRAGGSKRQQIEEEIADIAIYLLELADNLQIDLAGAIENKLRVNAKRYPAVKAKGKALKYTEL